MFSLVMLPPQMPQPMLDVIGMPLVNVPAFELRLHLAHHDAAHRRHQREPVDVLVVERIDAARVALAAGLEDLPHHVERIVEAVVLEDREHDAELLRREADAALPMLVSCDDEERLVRREA